MNMTVEKYVDIDVDVTLKCAACKEELQGDFDGDEQIEVQPHTCRAGAGFYTAEVAHDFRKKFGDEAADWLELQKMLFEK